MTRKSRATCCVPLGRLSNLAREPPQGGGHLLRLQRQISGIVGAGQIGMNPSNERNSIPTGRPNTISRPSDPSLAAPRRG